jgi:hypothetical protein
LASLLILLVAVIRWGYFYQKINKAIADKNEILHSVSAAQIWLVLIILPGVSVITNIGIFAIKYGVDFDVKSALSLDKKIMVNDNAWSVSQLNKAVSKINAGQSGSYKFTALRVGNRLFEYRLVKPLDIQASTCKVDEMGLSINCFFGEGTFEFSRYSDNYHGPLIQYKLNNRTVEHEARLYELAYIRKSGMKKNDQIIFCIRKSYFRQRYCRGEIVSNNGIYEFSFPLDLLPAYDEIRQAISNDLPKHITD